MEPAGWAGSSRWTVAGAAHFAVSASNGRRMILDYTLCGAQMPAIYALSDSLNCGEEQQNQQSLLEHTDLHQ